MAALLVRRVSGDFELLLCDSTNKPMSMAEAAFEVGAGVGADAGEGEGTGVGGGTGAGAGVPVCTCQPFLPGADMTFMGPASEIDRADLEQKAAILDLQDRPRVMKRLREQKQWEHR